MFIVLGANRDTASLNEQVLSLSGAVFFLKNVANWTPDGTVSDDV